MINYIIIGEMANDHSGNTYWNSEIGWTSNFKLAHTYNKEIMDYKYPTGTTGYMAVNEFGLPYRFFPLKINK